MDDYKTLVKDATRAVVKDGLGGAVWVHRLADAVESQRSRIAALEAVIGALQIDDPSAALDQMIREAKAEAWDEGAAANWDGQDLRHPNPYREVTD